MQGGGGRIDDRGHFSPREKLADGIFCSRLERINTECGRRHAYFEWEFRCGSHSHSRNSAPILVPASEVAAGDRCTAMIAAPARTSRNSHSNSIEVIADPPALDRCASVRRGLPVDGGAWKEGVPAVSARRIRTSSPVAGLVRARLTFVQVLGQSVSAVAPSAVMVTLPAARHTRRGPDVTCGVRAGGGGNDDGGRVLRRTVRDPDGRGQRPVQLHRQGPRADAGLRGRMVAADRLRGRRHGEHARCRDYLAALLGRVGLPGARASSRWWRRSSVCWRLR